MRKKYAALFAFTVTILSACTGVPTRKSDLNSIYVYHSGFGWRMTEYKIDFKENRLYEFGAGDYGIERNEKAKNQGYQKVTKLSESKLDEFVRKADGVGFFKWKELYDNDHILDGHQWGIEIVYADGRKKEISGSNKYPSSWNEMYDEFEKLTGKNILVMKSDWIENK